MRFRLTDRKSLPADAVERAYFTGLDEIPWRSRTQWTEEGLAVRRAQDDSGNFHIPWLVPGHGELSLQTGCLMERDEPYHLAVELARGTVNRIRNQLATWQASGVPIDEKPPLLSEALDLLSKSATRQQDPAVAEQLAAKTLSRSLDLIAQLSRAYADHALAMRRKQQNRATMAMGINLGNVAFGEAIGRYVINTFNAATVPVSWNDVEAVHGKRDWSLTDRQIDWCRVNGLKTLAGPLVAFDRFGLPPWLFLYEGDTDALAGAVEDYLREVVQRYTGRVHLWHVASRLNVHGTLDVTEEDRLRLAALAVETVRTIDARTPVILTIDQPWGEYMRSQDCDFSPLHFADALIRADIGLSGIGLEINLGYSQDSTQPRDAIDIVRHVDRWSSLGLPLMVTLTAPSGTGADAKARSKVQPLAMVGDEPAGHLQSQCVEQIIPLLFAKPAVQGVIWNQLLDAAPHELPNAGIFDGANQPKPIAATLREMTQKFLS